MPLGFAPIQNVRRGHLAVEGDMPATTTNTATMENPKSLFASRSVGMSNEAPVPGHTMRQVYSPVRPRRQSNSEWSRTLRALAEISRRRIALRRRPGSGPWVPCRRA